MKLEQLLYTLFSVLSITLCSRGMLDAQVTYPSLICNSDVMAVKFQNFYRKAATNYHLDTIQVALIADYALYQKNDHSVTQTESYLNQVFDRVQAIYAHDGIPIELTNIKVWASQDPYDLSSANEALTSFRSLTSIEEAYDIIHLLSGNALNHGGTAYLNGLCNRSYAYGYSNVLGVIDTSRNYNWDVHVVAHEIGHSLGSPHTNICVWGPDGDTALDGCGQVDQSCIDADIPIGGGGVMSSCHLYPASVRLDVGMGGEPAQVIRETILACGRTSGTVCSKSLKVNHGTHNVSAIYGGFGANQDNASHSRWYSFTSHKEDYLTIGSCDQSVDTRLFIYKGSCENLTLIASSDDGCHSGDGHFYASKVDSIYVEIAETIFIEWDDRWSSDGFTFYIQGSETSFCNDGIQNGNETGIDCGSECLPCQNPCSDPEALQSLIDNTFVYRTYETLIVNSEVLAPADVVLSSALAVQIDTSFRIEKGASLEISIELCDDDSPDLQNE